MKLLITRHGKTIWNEQKRTQGRVNNKLSAQGKQQSQQTAQSLKDIKIDYIFCSPLLRAVQTANIINQYHNKKIIKDERLTDINQGIFTGRFYPSLTPQELQIKKSRSKDFGMESLYEMYIRVTDFLNHLKQNYYNSTILIVTHSGVASFLELCAKYNNFDPQIFDRTDFFDNSQVKEINF